MCDCLRIDKITVYHFEHCSIIIMNDKLSIICFTLSIVLKLMTEYITSINLYIMFTAHYKTHNYFSVHVFTNKILFFLYRMDM
jgi:hypothetical protein